MNMIKFGSEKFTKDQSQGLLDVNRDEVNPEILAREKTFVEEITIRRFYVLYDHLKSSIKNKIEAGLPFVLDTESPSFEYDFDQALNTALVHEGAYSGGEDDYRKAEVEILERDFDSVVEIVWRCLESACFSEKAGELRSSLIKEVSEGLEIKNGRDFYANSYLIYAKIEHILRQRSPKMRLGIIYGYNNYSGAYSGNGYTESLHKPIVEAFGNPEKFNEMLQSVLAVKPTAEEVFHGRTTYHSESLGLAFDPEFHIEGGYQDGGRLKYVTLYIYSEEKEQLESTRVTLDYNDQTEETTFTIENDNEIAGKFGVSAVELYKQAIDGIKDKYSLLKKMDLSVMKRVDSQFDL